MAVVAEEIRPTGRGAGLADGATGTLDWGEAERRLNTGAFCWLATVRPDGAPHVMPVFAVWADGTLFVASKAAARKSRNLDADGRCVVTTDVDHVHLVVEGHGIRVRDVEALRTAAESFRSVYGWSTTVDGDLLDAEYGAPTSGGPPYAVYGITPTRAFALPAAATFMPTRWRFS